MNYSSQKTSVAMTAIVVALGTVVGSTAVNAFLMITPAYAELDDISREQIVGEIEIPDSDDIKEKAREIIASQPVPTLPELGTALIGARGPPVLAG
jgi:hypothetical protein